MGTPINLLAVMKSLDSNSDPIFILSRRNSYMGQMSRHYARMGTKGGPSMDDTSRWIGIDVSKGQLYIVVHSGLFFWTSLDISIR